MYLRSQRTARKRCMNCSNRSKFSNFAGAFCVVRYFSPLLLHLFSSGALNIVSMNTARVFAASSSSLTDFVAHEASKNSFNTMHGMMNKNKIRFLVGGWSIHFEPFSSFNYNEEVNMGTFLCPKRKLFTWRGLLS